MFYIFYMMIQQMAAMGYKIDTISWLLSQKYHGEWESLTNNPFNYLEQTKGETFIQFFPWQDLKQNYLTLTQICSIQIMFLDPIYFDEKLILGLFNITNMNETTLSWHGETDIVYNKYYKEKIGPPRISCKVEYAIQLNYHENEVDQKKLDFTIKLKNVKSDDKKCKIHLISEYQHYQSDIYKQILFYSTMLNVLCAIKYFCVKKLIDIVLRDDENSIVQGISIFCVGFVSINDSDIAVKNVFLAFRNEYPQYFFLSAFFFFIVLIQEIKLVLYIYTKRFQYQDQDQERKISIMRKYFLIQTFSAFIFAYLSESYELYNSFLLIIGFFMTPQIIHNIRLGTNPKFIPEYIFGCLSINIALPLYYRGNPNNFRRLKPSLEFCICLVLIYLVQILILYFQYKKGPHKIIPRCLLPKQYNYYQDYKPQELENCAICLLHLMFEPNQQEQDLDRMLVSKALMITPCGHKFHPSCLKSWMEVILSCPTCGNTIPPFYE